MDGVLEVGDHVGSYRIDAVLSSGGMGRTFLAHRVGAAGFTRQAAIKVIHPQLSSDESFVRMFIDEAKLCARIDHPNVVRVEELGEIEGGYFLAMEYVHGCTLAQLLKELGKRGRRLTTEVAVSIVIQAADGLHAAHEVTGEDGARLGVVHRDVSPQNILLATTGHVKVIDFGVAKTSKPTHAAASGLVGKVAYMSPEQAAGKPVDRRADVYALGIVLWEALAGRRLFSSPDPKKMLHSVLHPHVRRPSNHVPDLPPELDAIVLAALDPNPNERTETAFELRTKLAEVVPRALLVGPAQVAELALAVLPELAEAQEEAGNRPRTVRKKTVSSPSIDKATTPARYEVLDSVAIVDLMTCATIPVPESETWSLDDVPELAERTSPSAAKAQPKPPRGIAPYLVAGVLGTCVLLAVGAAAGLALVSDSGTDAAPLRATGASSIPSSPTSTGGEERRRGTPAVSPPSSPSLVPSSPQAPPEPTAIALDDTTPVRTTTPPRDDDGRSRATERARASKTRSTVSTRPTTATTTRPTTTTTTTRPTTTTRRRVPIVNDPGL